MKLFVSIGSGFTTTPVYHGARQRLDTNSMFPKSYRIAFFSDYASAALEYGYIVYKCVLREDRNNADLHRSNTDLYEKVIKHFKNSKLGSIINKGLLWQDKKLEKKVIEYVLSLGYDSVQITDTTSSGQEFTAIVVKNPHKFVKVLEEKTNIREDD